MAACSKRRVAEEDPVKDDLKKSRVEGSKSENADGEVAEKGGEPKASKSEEANTEAEKETEDNSELKEFSLGKRYGSHHVKLMLLFERKQDSGLLGLR